MSNTRQTGLAAGVVFFFLAVNTGWLWLDRSIPAWDDAYYLTNSLRTYDALTDRGLAGFVKQFLSGMSTKPPLIATLPTPIYLMVGRHPHAALVTNLLFLAVTLVATYLMGKTLGGSRAGLVALCVVGTMPMIYGLSRIFLVECGLTALVALALLILAYADTQSTWAPFALGVVFGVGLLMKSSFPLYLALPILWVLLRDGRTSINRRRILTFLVPLCVIAGPWYAVNVSAAIRTALAAGSAETARAYHTGGLAETGRYLGNLMNTGPALYFAALPVLAVLCMGRVSKASRRGIIFCLVAASPIVFLALSHYRDLRYATPLFPVIAVAVGILADSAISRFPAVATGFVALLLALATASMLDASFGLAKGKLDDGWLFSAARFSYVRPPQRAASPYRELLTGLEARGKWIVGGRHRLVLGSDTRYCNADTITLTALAARIPIEVATTAYESKGGLERSLAAASYFAYVDEAADSAFNPLGREAVGMVTADRRFREVASAILPDGSRLHVLEAQQTVPAGLTQAGAMIRNEADAIPQCSVKFADGLELTGLGLRPVPGGLEARYRWRCWRRVARDYWSFGHVLDAQGKVLAYLDHAMLQETPTSQWNVGDSAIETVVVPLQGGSAAAVRLGVFDRRSGERVAILSSNDPVTDSGTATIATVK